MKRTNNLYKEVTNIDNIIKMTNKVCSRVKNRRKVNNFETYKMEHICNIKRKLDSRNLKYVKYNIFMIKDPKCRIVMAEEIEDKIINHLIAEYVLVKVFENKYTDSMCATRIGKGTLYGINLLKKYINEIKRAHNNFYVLKIDIHKYFYKINHNILKKILSKKIKDKDSLKALYDIIDSTNNNYVNEEIKKIKDNRIKSLNKKDPYNKEKLIEEVMNIHLYEYGKGVALGNQTSQAFGLIYLYELNHYIKEKLNINCFINYMDDFIILHSNKEYLKFCLDKITKKLNKEYELEINPKKTIIKSIKNGIDFLGYSFYLKNNKLILKLKKKTKYKFKKKLNKLKFLYKNKYISKKELMTSISSYKGILMHGNCHNLYYQTMRRIV